MAKIYSTIDYVRDSFWIFDFLLDFFILIKKSLNKIVRRIVSYDFETYVFRIIENLPYGLAILFLGFFLTITLFRITEKQNGIIVSSINTNSMYPSILPGSLVITIPGNSYSTGDIITYKEKASKNNEYTGRVLTHRITDTKTGENNVLFYVAKGDNNKNPDASFIATSDILGKVRLILPYFGYIDFLSSTIPGFIILIGIPAYLVTIEARKYMKSA